jgi:hypothetical protein
MSRREWELMVRVLIADGRIKRSLPQSREEIRQANALLMSTATPKFPSRKPPLVVESGRDEGEKEDSLVTNNQLVQDIKITDEPVSVDNDTSPVQEELAVATVIETSGQQEFPLTTTSSGWAQVEEKQPVVAAIVNSNNAQNCHEPVPAAQEVFTRVYLGCLDRH